jgi:hypothetical protein
MAKSLALEIPNTSQIFASNKLSEALAKIEDETSWSFQTKTGGWLIPGMVASLGTVTTTPYSNEVIGDAVASAIWAGLIGHPFLTELQFRNPSYALYDIVAINGNNPPFITLVLDRPWMEPPAGPGQQYYIYQAYFPVPVLNFRSFSEIRDTTNGDWVSYTGISQDDLSLEDPQRVIFGPALPTYAVPFGIDQRPNSATPGYLRYEVWPHILSLWPLAFTYKYQGPQLVNPSDMVPNPITEELVMWRAKEMLYQYAEAQKGQDVQRGSGADFRFLAEMARKEYVECLKKTRAVDANLHNDFFTRPKRRSDAMNDGFSTTRLGQLNVGRW